MATGANKGRLNVTRGRVLVVSFLAMLCLGGLALAGCSTAAAPTTAPSAGPATDGSVPPSTPMGVSATSTVTESTTTSAAAGSAPLTTAEYLAQLDLAKIMDDGADYASIASRTPVDPQAVVQQLLAKYKNVDRTEVLKAIFRRLTSGAKTETDKEKAVVYFVQKLSVHDFASPFMRLPIFDPLILLDIHAMDCQKCSRLIADLYAAAGYQSRVVDMYGHMVAEVTYDGGWHYADADFFGGGQVVTMPDGHIPSMAELSHNYRLLDNLQPYLEMNVVFSYGSSGKGPSVWTYPSYSYFSAQNYSKNPGYPYYLYKQAAPATSTEQSAEQEMMYGWDERAGEVRRESASDITLSNIPEISTPNVPRIMGVSVDGSSATLSFSADDPEGTLGTYVVFVSRSSRGWDYGSFAGAEPAKHFWANPGGWTSSMYDSLFALPPHDVAELSTKTGTITLPHLAPGRYFVSVMATDSYGETVGKLLYPLSNEVAIAIG